MTVESVTYISDLDPTYPADGDVQSEGDNHIRNIKTAITGTFTGITGPVTATQAELNILDGATVTTAEVNLLDGVTAVLDGKVQTDVAVFSPMASGTGIAGSGTVAHALGAMPDLVMLTAVATTTDNGYSSGAELEVPTGSQDGADAVVTIQKSTTGFIVKLKGPLYALDATDSAAFNLRNGNWNLKATLVSFT